MEGWTDPPPPIPATARAAIKAPIEGAKPHSMVPDPNKDRASNIAPFRPRMSAKRPYRGVKQQTDSRYDVPM